MADESARLAELLTVPCNFNLRVPGVPLPSWRPLLIAKGTVYKCVRSRRSTLLSFTYKPESCFPPAEYFFTVRLRRLLALLSRPLLFYKYAGSSLNISGASSLPVVAAVAEGPLRPGSEESEPMCQSKSSEKL